MQVVSRQWSKDEFKAYLLLFSAQANMVESASEKAFILQRVGVEHYEHIHEEIDKDNDYQSIQKILDYLQRFIVNLIIFKPKKSFKNFLRLVSIVLYITLLYKVVYKIWNI